MSSAITMEDVGVLLAMRERAQSEYAHACRELVDNADDRRAQTVVVSNAKRLANAQRQYTAALEEIGGVVRPVVEGAP